MMPDPSHALSQARIEAVARTMQHWAENDTIHLSGHVPMSWDEDDSDWWLGLAQVATSAADASLYDNDPALVRELDELREALRVIRDAMKRSRSRSTRTSAPAGVV